MQQTESLLDGHVISTSDLLEELAHGLCSLTGCLDAWLSNAVYTGCIIASFAGMGKKRRYSAHPDPANLGSYKEYLFDSSWWNGSELVLAVESEWGRWGDVKYDFPKLLVAKAPVKVLITDSGCHGGNHRLRFKAKLEEMLQQSPRHIAGERYIWVDVAGAKMGGHLFGFECTIARDGRCPDAKLTPTSPESVPYTFGSGL